MNDLVSLSAIGAQRGAAEFRIGIRSEPYLADHGYQDMVVLPGSFYIATALRANHERSARVPGLLRNITFHNPIILSAEQTVIKLEVSERGIRFEYHFSEASADAGSGKAAAGQYAA